jgi:hypothetical protein
VFFVVEELGQLLLEIAQRLTLMLAEEDVELPVDLLLNLQILKRLGSRAT